MFDSLGGLIGDAIKIVKAPVEVALDVTRVVTKPVADAAEAVADEVKSITEDITKK